MSGNFSSYYDDDLIAAAIAGGEHRGFIGGMWDEIGDLQIDYLKSQGMTQKDTLLDIGCGSLRLGVRAVEFLNSGNYWGTDLSAALLNAGYEKEIVPAGLGDKLPRSHLVPDGQFKFSGVPMLIDVAIAQSVFTHLPLNHMRLCLVNLARHLTGPCTFYFTVFVPPDGLSVTESHRQPIWGVVTHPDRDPYHYTAADLHFAASGTPWSIELIGEWRHPRNQMMVKASKA
jgi:SAM-dependent methyltransferase